MSLRFLLASALVLAASFSAPAMAQRGGICFFEDADFSGREFCLNPGQSMPRLDPYWNDRISSVEIPQGVRTTVCEHENFGGRCIQLDRSVRNFEQIGMNDEVSSISADAIRQPPPRAYNEPPPPPMPPRGPPPVISAGPDDLRDQMFRYRGACDSGDRRACVRLGIIIGENRGRNAQWRREDPDLFFWER